ncbi:hypothetical protein [Bosea sp. (in: a-proteobacteria)]|jgi:hypothetical protein|uniref:hypothetical protein n=1 Tax=Bosea sp. (in: a-proteobacteria) TaxID=1871050 RepID=UPI003F7131A2
MIRLLIAMLLAAIVSASMGTSLAQPRPPAPPTLSASRSVMAGTMLSVFVGKAPDAALLAIARPTDAPETAFVSIPLGLVSAASITTPGEAGVYELRLLRENAGKSEILARQPLATTTASATLAAPDKVKANASFAARGIGPNGGRDRVVIVAPDAAVDAAGPSFLPAENVEATLEAPDTPGIYELRYVMNAPVSGQRILARRPLTVE